MSVGKLPISVGEFQRTYYRQRQVYDRLYQGRLEEPMLRQIQQQTLESLVGERLVELEAKRLGVSVSDEAVARAIAASPENQDEGRFIGVEELRRRLDLQGMTEEQFAESHAPAAAEREPAGPRRLGRRRERRRRSRASSRAGTSR